jgi:hypothetical protein
MFRIRPLGVFIVFVTLDILCMGMGMGVPFFNIVFGFVVGWYLVEWISIGTREVKEILRRLLIYSCITAGVTFLGMVLVWGWSLTLLFDPQADLAGFGVPQILFEARASFIGWLVLMVVISPFLQLLTTIFAGHLTLVLAFGKEKS